MADNKSISGVEFNIEDSIVKGIILGYFESMRDKLLNGESVYIEGIGIVRCKYRKVRNTHGREYSIKLTIDQDRDFQKDLVEAYSNNPDKFSKSIKRCND